MAMRIAYRGDWASVSERSSGALIGGLVRRLRKRSSDDVTAVDGFFVLTLFPANTDPTDRTRGFDDSSDARPRASARGDYHPTHPSRVFRHSLKCYFTGYESARNVVRNPNSTGRGSSGNGRIGTKRVFNNVIEYAIQDP